MRLSFLLLLSAGLLLAQCKKHDPTPLEQLPPTTQTGANTFGCLINGEAYMPKGSPGQPGYAVLYDPTFQKGTLQIYTYQARSTSARSLDIGCSGVDQIGTYSVPQQAGATFYKYGQQSPCDRYASAEAGTYCRGRIIITRLDYQAGVIAGTFALTLHQPGCDSIRVTQGRFDKKL